MNNPISTQEALRDVEVIVRQAPAGVLATVDEQGQPHIRWMGSVLIDHFSRLITITAPNSHKIEHITHNPRVCWMFTNEAMDRIVYFYGKAVMVDDARSLKQDWSLLSNKSRAYFLKFQSEGIGFAVLETLVETIEYLVPQTNLLIRMQPLGRPISS